MMFDEREPCFVISVAARMLGLHAQSLRYYEKMGLIEPARSRGRVRFYSQRDIERLRQIKTLMNDLGVNLAGVEVILRLTEKIADMENRIEELERQLDRSRRAES